MRIVGYVVGTILVITVAVWGSFALYEGSWDLTAHNTQHQLEIQQQQVNGQASIAATSWSYKTMVGQQIISGIDSVNHDTVSIDGYQQAGNSVQATNETNQRSYDAGQVCYYASEVPEKLPPSPQTSWIDKNCTIVNGLAEGDLSPSSIFFTNGN
jgi:hypothetical protein